MDFTVLRRIDQMGSLYLTPLSRPRIEKKEKVIDRHKYNKPTIKGDPSRRNNWGYVGRSELAESCPHIPNWQPQYP